MCFSAAASFATAGITVLAGGVALSRIRSREEAALAMLPVLFAAQQTAEGLLWQTLPENGESEASVLAIIFLIFAKVVWPILVPASALLVETSSRRRTVMTAFLALGIIIGAYFLWSILASPVVASIGHRHIVYAGEPLAPMPIAIGYFAVVGLTAGFSSFLALRLLAMVVFAGAITSYIFYWEAFSSVWCFFAAAASVIIVLHFVQVRRADLVAAGR